MKLTPPVVTRHLQSLLCCGSCLVPADIRHRRGGVKQVLINPNHCAVLTYLKKGGNRD